MKQLVISIVLGTIAAFLLGFGAIALYDWNFPLSLNLYSALCLSLLINLDFFFIRRWDGCIEKLGGFTFTLFLFLASFLISGFMVSAGILTWVAVLPTLWFLGFQFIAIGVVSTHFLRTTNYTPPKPGEPLL